MDYFAVNLSVILIALFDKTVVHKAQGLTLNDVWIDLGPSERAARLTYTLTRFCEIFNLVIEPVTFDGLKSLIKTSNYKFKVLEKTRLNNLSKTQ